MPVFVLDPRLLDAGRFPSPNRGLVPALGAARAAGGVARARRRAGGAGGPPGGGSARRWPAPPARRPSTSPPTSRPSRAPATAGSPRRSTASRRCAARPATSSPTSASRRPRTAARIPSSARSGAPGSGCRGATCSVRRARLTVPRRARARPRRRTAAGAARPPSRAAPGENAAREQLRRWLERGLDTYADRHDRLAGGTSRLSPHLHFGCVSAREVEQRARAHGGARRGRLRAPARLARLLRTRAAASPGQRAPRLQAAVRRAGVVARRRGLRRLVRGAHRLPGGRRGHAPAAPRGLDAQPRAPDRAPPSSPRTCTSTGARASAHFMRHLLCGDEAQNNGNWQWITSIGVDPAPYFRRMYNPSAQQRRHDPGRRATSAAGAPSWARCRSSGWPSRGR